MSNYLAVMVEDMRADMKALIEIVASMRESIADLPTRDEFEDLKQDVKVIKKAVMATNLQVKNHEQRLTRLESRQTTG